MMGWRIELLGTLRAECAEREIVHFRTHKTSALLAYLAYYAQRTHRRDELIEKFWPNDDATAARNSFRVALNTLRQLLSAPETSPNLPIRSDRHNVALEPDTFQTDVARFERAIQAARRMENPQEQPPLLLSAVEEYGGPLLPGRDEDWIMPERQRLEDLYLWALDGLTRSAVLARNYEQAIEFARRAIHTDPLREGAHRSLMQLYKALGRPAAALRQYRELERLLAEEMGAQPSAPTRDLAESLVAAERNRPNGAETVIVSTAPTTPSKPRSQRGSGRESAEPRLPPGVEGQWRLPPRLNRIFGREEEIAQVTDLLVPKPSDPRTESRLVTLTGPGGAGKTRLALEVAWCCRAAFAGRVGWASLAERAEARHIPELLIDAVEARRCGQTDLLEHVIRTLADRSALLILDNFEHLLEEGVEIVRTLRTRLPTLTLLVTSRQRLDLEGEREMFILPLPTPVRPGTPERLLEFPSVQLFADRAQAVQPTFQVTSANATAIGALCHRLEGIPLALELVAAWTAALTPEEMLPRLSGRSCLLVSRKRDVTARHRTLRATVEWSYRLLSPDLQRFFTRLSVFRGGWTAEAAEAVCEEPEALERLMQLRSRSLILVEVDRTGMTRYRFLETVREFAEERLSEEERALTRQRHAEYCRNLAAQLSAAGGSERQVFFVERFAIEYENLHAALSWFNTQVDVGAYGLRMALTMVNFWRIQGHISEARERLHAALAWCPERQPGPWRASALAEAAAFASLQGDPIAHALLDEATAIPGITENPAAMNYIHNNRGNVCLAEGDHAAAYRHFAECLDNCRAIFQEAMAGMMLLNMALCAQEQGDVATARHHCEESLAIGRKTGSNCNLATASQIAGALAAQDGDVERAQKLFEASIAEFRKLHDRNDITGSLRDYAFLLIADGHCAKARDLLAESLALSCEIGHAANTIGSVEAIAYWNLACGSVERAARLYSAIECRRKTLGEPMRVALREMYERRLLVARAADHDGAFARAWVDGRSLTLDEAIQEARECTSETSLC